MNTDQIKRLLDFCVERNSKGDATFFSFRGHINSVSVQCFVGTWHNRKPESLDKYLYLHATEEEVDELIREINALKL